MSDTVKWHDRYSVGFEEMDADHKHLLSLIQEASALSKLDVNDEEVIKKFKVVLDQLVAYTKSHFQREEKLMRDNGFPDLERHQGIHQDLVENLRGMQQEFKASGPKVFSKLVVFLSTWWNSHILGTDQEYAAYLADKSNDAG